MKKLLNTLKLFILILFLLFLISACTTMPVPPVNGLGYGNIQVYSEPTDAYIYLDGTNTGYKTPGFLKHLCWQPSAYPKNGWLFE